MKKTVPFTEEKGWELVDKYIPNEIHDIKTTPPAQLAGYYAEYPDYIPGGRVSYKYDGRSKIFMDPGAELFTFVHEISHVILGHMENYYASMRHKNVYRLEQEAWDQARQICLVENIPFDEEKVSYFLKTYED